MDRIQQAKAQEAEDNLYHELATEWALKVEASRNKS